MPDTAPLVSSSAGSDAPADAPPAPADAPPASRRKRNLIVLVVLGAAWFLLDRATKTFFNDGSFALGEHITDPFLGLFRFTLVHNTGGAWGIFDDATFALGLVSLIVVAALVAFLLLEAQACIGQAIGIALIAAGGIGNAFDRFALGYVVDFIEFTFIDFPVFNLADIGVTCGLVLVLVSMFVSFGKARS